MEHQEDKKYLRIESWLRARIERRHYAPDEPIESEHELAAQFCVSRATARHALERLAADGLIERRQGRRSYIKNDAQPYIGRRFGRVGLISYDMDHYMFDGLKEGAISALSAGGYEVVIRDCAESAAAKRSALSELMRLPLDGYIIEGIGTGLPSPNLDLYQRIEAQRTPIVFTDGYHQGVRAAHVVGNDREIVHQMVTHLVGLGHTRIGGIFSPVQYQGLMRYQGFIDGLLEHGLEYRDQRVMFLHFGDRQYIFDNLFNAYREGITECTAMVCYNDIIARFLEMTLLRNGITVPDRMSITGLDNYESAQRGALKLTSATHPQHEMGRKAAEMLMQMIETRADVENVVMRLPFVSGETTGPAPS